MEAFTRWGCGVHPSIPQGERLVGAVLGEFDAVLVEVDAVLVEQGMDDTFLALGGGAKAQGIAPRSGVPRWSCAEGAMRCAYCTLRGSETFLASVCDEEKPFALRYRRVNAAALNLCVQTRLEVGEAHPIGTNTLQLLHPTTAKRDEFLSLAQDWRDHDSDRYADALQDFDAYVANVKRREAAHQPDGWIPSTEFWLEHETQLVACVRLRFHLTPALEREGGHIGYDVRPSMRGRGFGAAALRLVLPHARARGLNRVLLTVDADNHASLKIIERHGGVFAGEGIATRSGKPHRRYWIALTA